MQPLVACYPQIAVVIWIDFEQSPIQMPPKIIDWRVSSIQALIFGPIYCISIQYPQCFRHGCHGPDRVHLRNQDLKTIPFPIIRNEFLFPESGRRFYEIGIYCLSVFTCQRYPGIFHVNCLSTAYDIFQYHLLLLCRRQHTLDQNLDTIPVQRRLRQLVNARDRKRKKDEIYWQS